MRRIFRFTNCGVSLVELMIVMVLVAGLAATAVSAFGDLIAKSRISAATTTLQAALLLARAEAIKRDKNVVICRSTNPNTVTPSCTSNGGVEGSDAGWGDGWIIFVDQDSDKKFSSRDALVQVQSAIFSRPADGAIIPTPNRSYLSFTPTGQTFGSYMRFTIRRPESNLNSSHDRYLCLASGGRARVDDRLCVNK
ncbi:GspH/FimT family pseudopilin [Undibacterium danionis]|uniref:Type II secretion system protein H n=1 Tax=Undibacterium danionis TaxID=1812100 RepID=A0ABV6IJ87_9BURK